MVEAHTKWVAEHILEQYYHGKIFISLNPLRIYCDNGRQIVRIRASAIPLSILHEIHNAIVDEERNAALLTYQHQLRSGTIVIGSQRAGSDHVAISGYPETYVTGICGTADQIPRERTQDLDKRIYIIKSTAIRLSQHHQPQLYVQLSRNNRAILGTLFTQQTRITCRCTKRVAGYSSEVIANDWVAGKIIKTISQEFSKERIKVHVHFKHTPRQRDEHH